MNELVEYLFSDKGRKYIIGFGICLLFGLIIKFFLIFEDKIYTIFKGR